MKTRFASLAAGALGAALFLTGCSGAGEPAAPEPAAPESPSSEQEALSVGFFGFAAINGFAQGTFVGVEQAAAENNATATFVDGAFDGQAQVQQVRDAITSRQFDVIVIQANDNVALQAPLQEAADAGITVVVEFSVVGPDFTTIEPQVDGAISVVELPTDNGVALAELGIEACATVEAKPCQVAYLEGFRSLPLDNARTEAVKATLATDDTIELVASVEGGYAADSGRAAFQNVLQANPDVDVVIGASAAIVGAADVAGDSDVLFIGNGASQANVESVRNGDWFAVFVQDVVANGKKATELGLALARGEEVEMAIDGMTLAPNNGRGTKAALDEVDFVAGYTD
ncbi:monosaccharide ABC transporter substrate-binding protein (CUT2 family) [Microcella alkaliphila]|uniref:Monosaccharide ABC transporter substrate-binding protein (CUT2 family) n=1 Tax=Microcella alkaliphila TaxID=279828 RepID=A0A4Q7TJU4_9MICO|nr:sugar ABC transporter substrate-binding protein [Microcella alkaliphila]RZT60906.1 monosaccharide ABC transporter substrate-binding protein (CUT2 family) [Microcella alkaliphila]